MSYTLITKSQKDRSVNGWTGRWVGRYLDDIELDGQMGMSVDGYVRRRIYWYRDRYMTE